MRAPPTAFLLQRLMRDPATRERWRRPALLLGRKLLPDRLDLWQYRRLLPERVAWPGGRVQAGSELFQRVFVGCMVFQPQDFPYLIQASRMAQEGRVMRGKPGIRDLAFTIAISHCLVPEKKSNECYFGKALSASTARRERAGSGHRQANSGR